MSIPGLACIVGDVPPKKLLRTKAQFAKLLGVPRATIGYACKPGRALADAFSGTGQAGRIDVNHPAAKSYAKARAAKGKPPNTGDKKGRGRRGSPSKGDAVQYEREAWAVEAGRQARVSVEEILASRGGTRPSAALERPDISILEAQVAALPADIRAVLDYKLADVVDLWGNVPGFETVLKAAKTVTEIDYKRTKAAQLRGELIDRELVRVHVMAAIDDALLRLLSDTPRTMAARVFALVKSKATVVEVEGVLRELMSQQVKDMKLGARKGLKLSKKQAMVAGDDEAAA